MGTSMLNHTFRSPRSWHESRTGAPAEEESHQERSSNTGVTGERNAEVTGSSEVRAQRKKKEKKSFWFSHERHLITVRRVWNHAIMQAGVPYGLIACGYIFIVSLISLFHWCSWFWPLENLFFFFFNMQITPLVLKQLLCLIKHSSKGRSSTLVNFNS